MAPVGELVRYSLLLDIFEAYSYRLGKAPRDGGMRMLPQELLRSVQALGQQRNGSCCESLWPYDRCAIAGLKRSKLKRLVEQILGLRITVRFSDFDTGASKLFRAPREFSQRVRTSATAAL